MAVSVFMSGSGGSVYLVCITILVVCSNIHGAFAEDHKPRANAGLVRSARKSRKLLEGSQNENKAAIKDSLKFSEDNTGQVEAKVLFRKRKHAGESSHGLEKKVHTVVAADAAMKQSSAGSEHNSISSEFRLSTSVGQNNMKIPNQVILTGHKEIWEVLQKRKELLAGLGISPDMRVRYFNNNACHQYLQKHYSDLVKFFDQEDNGSYKGDICRTAVLANEGGFYIDLDMQLRTPLKALVDDSTTFMTARSAEFGCLNALMAAVPKSPAMLNTVEHIRKWYAGETTPIGQLGTTTLQRGLGEMMSDSCPEVMWSDAYQQFQCGPDHSIRLFSEKLLDAGDCSHWGSTMCPEPRARSAFSGVRYGLFDGRPEMMHFKASPSAEDILAKERMFIGWPRFEGCHALGCDMSGGTHA